ncbi:MAG: hypothetical protein ACYCY9_10805 [Thiobacillus sp.]
MSLHIDRAVAAHEAAHVICGVAVGRRVSEVTLDPGDGNLGLCCFATVRHSRKQAVHDLHVMVSLVAGELAESQFDCPDLECQTTERGIARRHCAKIAPALGVEGEWLYRFVLTVARHCLKINAVQFDRVRWALERERQISGVRLSRLTVGIRRVNLAGSLTAHRKAHAGPVKY